MIEPIDMIISVVVAIIGANGFWVLLNNWATNRSRKKSAETLALRGILHSMLYDKCTTYINRGEITAAEYADLQSLYAPYIALGGNDVIKHLMEDEINELEITRKGK